MTRRGANEGSIFKRSDGRWCARIMVNGRPKHFYGRTRAEVAGRLAVALRNLQHGIEPSRSDRLTVAAWAERWLAAVKPSVRPATWRRYESLFGLHIVPELGKTPVAKLTPTMVERTLNAGLAAGMAPRSVSHARAALRTSLNAAIRDGIVSRNVASLARPPRVPEREITVLTPAQANELLTAARDDRLYALFVAALGTGARQGELLALRWSDVDLDAPRITVRGSLQRGADGRVEIAETKTHRSRRPLVPPAVVVEALREHRVRQLRERMIAGTRWDGSLDLVFPNSIGRPSDGPVVTRRLQAICQRAGLPRVTFHSLRHSAATFLLGSGTPARIVADVLGHSSTRLLDVYAHVLDEYRHDAARRMDAILGGAR